MKLIQTILGLLCAFALMVTLLITSVEAVTYWTPGYYEKEYRKYNVLENVRMEMDDLLDVTSEMMAYLRGRREDLHVPTTVNGQPREFFNEREIAHMEDVRGLFLGAIAVRQGCLIIIMASLAILLYTRANLKRLLPRTLCAGTLLFFALLAVLAAIIASDFSRYFIVFHHIFFNNDLWMLDPRTDLLINIVPEPFFMDTAARIAITYGASVLVVFLASCGCMLRTAKKSILSFFLCLSLFLGLFAQPAYAAPAWPNGPSIMAEGGILIDGNSGAVLYGKNIHEQYFPASITKILTALIIIENCSLDEVVTFSHNAVYNVETNSSNANLEEGDRLTVLDCLYAMMLKSANEAANALAEHAASSTEAFSAMMNAKALSLGCTDSHFSNPSGLNNPDHYTSAHDMALIAQAAFQNEVFSQIVSTLYYDLPPTKRNREGLRIYPGHQMIKKNSPNYYAGAVGGKTGYTTLAGNTLVTCARRNGMQLITVVLNGHQTHYSDTRAMLNFGFRNFRCLEISDYDSTYASIENDLTVAGLPTTDLSILRIQENRQITLPNNAEFSDTASSISYELPAGAPKHAAAWIRYDYGGHLVGSTYLLVGHTEPESSPPLREIPLIEPQSLLSEESPGSEIPAESAAEKSSAPAFHIPPQVMAAFWILLAAAASAVIGYALLCWFLNQRKRESANRMLRRQRRQQRLQDIGISNDEFQHLLEQKRKRPSLLDGARRRPGKRYKHY